MTNLERARRMIDAWYADELARCLRDRSRPTPSGDYTALADAIAAALDAASRLAYEERLRQEMDR